MTFLGYYVVFCVLTICVGTVAYVAEAKTYANYSITLGEVFAFLFGCCLPVVNLLLFLSAIGTIMDYTKNIVIFKK